jgi:hypothetical protein
MAMLHRRRIRVSRLLVHLIDDEHIGGVEEDRKSPRCCSHGVG